MSSIPPSNYDQKLKHLEFIQAVITRMNSNSFLIKGWSVSLVVAIFALAAKDADIKYAVIAYIPVLIFWSLDGFFLSQERQYRELYAEVAAKPENDIDFSMDASHWDNKKRTWTRSAFSSTLLLFHIPLIVVIAIVMFVMPHLRS